MNYKNNSLETAGFGERLRFLRERAGLGQTALARKLGYKRSNSVSNLEADKSPPSLQILQKIAELFNTNLHWLITGKPSPDGESWRESYGELFRMYSSDGGLWIDRLGGRVADLKKMILDLRERESGGDKLNAEDYGKLEIWSEEIRIKQNELDRIKDHLKQAIDWLGGIRIEY